MMSAHVYWVTQALLMKHRSNNTIQPITAKDANDFMIERTSKFAAVFDILMGMMRWADAILYP